MTALQAASAGVKDMADGSLRISIDFEPRHAKAAFALFGARGTQLGVAALKDGSFLAQPAADMVIPITEPKPREPLGDACYRTVTWCANPHFWNFLNNTAFSSDAPFDVVKNKEDAKCAVLVICNVLSRQYLDTDNEANKLWHREIRQPYSDYLKRLDAA